MQLRKFGLKTALIFLQGLIYIKRALTFLFLALGGWLNRLAPPLARYFLFPLYKIYLFLRKQLNFLIDPLARRLLAFSLGRMAAVLTTLFLVFALLGSETKAYGANRYLNGQHSLIFSYVSVEGDFDITEELITEVPLQTVTPPWLTGVAAVPGPFSQAEIPLEEITGSAFEGLALVQPLFLPGAIFGTARTKTIYHVVEAGDTFGALANKFGVNIETILWANNLSIRSVLHPGDVLKILPVSGIAHKVKKGDTIKKIAELYSTTEEKIRDFNHLSGANLLIGEEIIAPDGRIRGVAPVPGSLYAVPPRQTVVRLPPSAERLATGFIWPTVSRRITQYFRWLHPGIDIGLPSGNPIYACADGVVEISGWNRGGYGYQILLNHGNGMKTRYAHASRLYIRAGETVEKGQVIGLVGSTGRSSGPHLHFEISVNGSRVNPLLYTR